MIGERSCAPSERAKAPSSASPNRGRSRSIERIVNPLLRVPVGCVQYTTREASDCVQDQLYALIDRYNRLPCACFPYFGLPGERSVTGRNPLTSGLRV